MEDSRVETDLETSTLDLEVIRGMGHSRFIAWLQQVRVTGTTWNDAEVLQPLRDLRFSGALRGLGDREIPGRI
jgi:hypothetical protein